MDDFDNIEDGIQQLFGENHESFRILEEQIDIDLQMEYFEFAKNLKEEIKHSREEILNSISVLFDEKSSIHDKKTTLIFLASIDEVSALRAIEKFIGQSEGELQIWAKLAFNESKMLLESSFLGENTVFISTGMGGKDGKLRFFLVLLSKNESYNETQQKVIENEFEIGLKQAGGCVESVEFDNEIAGLVCLIPVNINVKVVFRDIVKECNNYGDFVKSEFILTNVKKLSRKEISDFIEKNKNK